MADEQPEVPGGKGTSHARSTPGRAVATIGMVVAVIGLIFTLAGVVTYVLVGTTLSEEKVTVSADASLFAGDAVDGPFTAYVEADTIAKHAEEIAEGETYAELPQDDPRRATVMTASFLRASLFTSVVAFGVAALVFVLGLVLMAVGWSLRRLANSLPG